MKVAVIDKNYNPGGSCGIFKRGAVTFDIGAAMLYGFGESGFNAHRFVFNCLEEPIDMIRHDLLYCVNYQDQRIFFWSDVENFADELAKVFPSEQENIHRFYRDMTKMYQHIMVETPNYTTPDETDPKEGLKSLLKHPISYAKFIGYLNKSARSLLQKYFTDPEIFNFSTNSLQPIATPPSRKLPQFWQL
jgi:prolycopene isomerase